MFSYENGLVLSALLYIYQMVNLLISINSQFEKNLNKIGERLSWLSLQPKQMTESDVHGSMIWKIGKFSFIALFQGVFVLLSWVNVLICVAMIVYAIAKDRGAPNEIKAFRWRMRNQNLTFDEIIRELMKANGTDPSLFETVKKETIESLRENELMKSPV